jgi:hypothetical protein
MVAHPDNGDLCYHHCPKSALSGRNFGYGAALSMRARRLPPHKSGPKPPMSATLLKYGFFRIAVDQFFDRQIVPLDILLQLNRR